MTVNNQPNPFEFSEADTCREFVTPAIQAAGWGDSPFEIAEQRSFTDGRIVLTGRTAKRREGTVARCGGIKRRSRRFDGARNQQYVGALRNADHSATGGNGQSGGDHAGHANLAAGREWIAGRKKLRRKSCKRKRT